MADRFIQSSCETGNRQFASTKNVFENGLGIVLDAVQFPVVVFDLCQQIALDRALRLLGLVNDWPGLFLRYVGKVARFRWKHVCLSHWESAAFFGMGGF